VAILDFLFRLGAALLMGAVVGSERLWRQRMAGTRTNALVAAGASAFLMCAFMVRDTSRSEAQIVSYSSSASECRQGDALSSIVAVRPKGLAAFIWPQSNGFGPRKSVPSFALFSTLHFRLGSERFWYIRLASIAQRRQSMLK
jgi:hypothetical protein